MQGDERRFALVQKIDAARRQTHPLDDRLALRLGADDFQQAVAQRLRGGGAVRSVAAEEQARQLAAFVQTLLAWLAQRLAQCFNQRLFDAIHASITSLKCAWTSQLYPVKRAWDRATGRLRFSAKPQAAQGSSIWLTLPPARGASSAACNRPASSTSATTSAPSASTSPCNTMRRASTSSPITTP